MLLTIEFFYPNLDGKKYFPVSYPYKISKENMSETLQEPNPLDYAYETMKLLIMEKYENRPIGKVSSFFARIDAFENEFYDFLVFAFNSEDFKEDNSFKNRKWNSIDEGLKHIKKKSSSIVEIFIKIMEQ